MAFEIAGQLQEELYLLFSVTYALFQVLAQRGHGAIFHPASNQLRVI
jgi:hypothetical protein